jgi:hypothetical protein
MASSPPPGTPERFDVRAARDTQDALGPLNARGPLPHAESLHALDWLNFFLAALLMGFGPFVAVKLADRGWVPANIGLVLTASGVAGLLTQVPAGELIDMSRSKRMLVGMATTAIISGVLVFGLRPDFPSVFTAALIQGTAGSVLGPGVAAISLGLVGQEALAERLGRNRRFASIGGLTAAGIMGVIGYLPSTADIFLVTAAFGIPVILALVRIRADDIHFGRSCRAPDHRCAHLQRSHSASLMATWSSGAMCGRPWPEPSVSKPGRTCQRAWQRISRKTRMSGTRSSRSTIFAHGTCGADWPRGPARGLRVRLRRPEGPRAFVSTIKLRQAGFTKTIDTEETPRNSFCNALKSLIDHKLLPPAAK